METTIKTTLDMLTSDSVSVKRETFILYNGKETLIDTWRRAYVNSVAGRTAVQAELSSGDAEAVFAKWGENHTVTDGETA